MSLTKDIINFFVIPGGSTIGGKNKTKTITDFLDFHKLHKPDPTGIGILTDKFLLDKIVNTCHKLTNEGILHALGNQGGGPILGESFMTNQYNPDLLNYGRYDFLINGFLSIRNHFKDSVRYVEITMPKGDKSIGSCFVIGPNSIITAYHCIDNMDLINIPDNNGVPVKANEIWIPEDENKDLTLIQTEGEPFKEIPHFLVGQTDILSEVLTLGYPPIPGFKDLLLADKSEINASIKTSTGNIVGKGKSYSDKQDYHIINARVKGGNSGGPVIDKYGMVVGVLTHIPADPQETEKMDELGYGIALKGEEVVHLVNQVEKKENVRMVKFTNVDNGFKTSK